MDGADQLPRACVIDVVGLGLDHVGRMPRLGDWAAGQRVKRLRPDLPAVTATMQAGVLTGARPAVHGIVANGWLHRETMEVRFGSRNHHLLPAPTLLGRAASRARDRGAAFRSAQLFWCFDLGSPADLTLTFEPYHASDGSRVGAVQGNRPEFARHVEDALGPFPADAWWGPTAAVASSEWIARAAAWTLREHAPQLTLVHLPHLGFDLQRHGPTAEVLARNLGELDACLGIVLDACEAVEAQPLVLSGFTVESVTSVVFPNRVLREGGWLAVRAGPFGEMLDTYASRAFAVCDHQIAHVYVADPADLDDLRTTLERVEGVEMVLARPELEEIGLDHPRSGELVLVARAGSWFAYPYWLDPMRAPDFAPTVDIGRKPGYDPCELCFDPSLPVPRMRMAMRRAQERLGLRCRMDVVAVDATVVRGSYGRASERDGGGPACIGPAGTMPDRQVSTAELHDLVLAMLDLEAPS